MVVDFFSIPVAKRAGLTPPFFAGRFAALRIRISIMQWQCVKIICLTHHRAVACRMDSGTGLKSEAAYIMVASAAVRGAPTTARDAIGAVNADAERAQRARRMNRNMAAETADFVIRCPDTLDCCSLLPLGLLVACAMAALTKAHSLGL